MRMIECNWRVARAAIKEVLPTVFAWSFRGFWVRTAPMSVCGVHTEWRGSRRASAPCPRHPTVTIAPTRIWVARGGGRVVRVDVVGCVALCPRELPMRRVWLLAAAFVAAVAFTAGTALAQRGGGQAGGGGGFGQTGGGGF